MKLKKFNEINEEDRFGFDDIDQPFEKSKGDKDLSWLDDDIEDEEAKQAAKSDLKSDPGYKKLNVDDKESYSSYDYGYEDDDPYSSDTYSSTSKPKREKVELTPEQEETVDELTYLLRKMISNSNISNFYVMSDGFDICIQFILQKNDKMRSIMKIVNILKKIKDDILIQYDSEIEMWETTKGEPLFTIDFYYEANKQGYKKNVAPF